MSSVNDPDVLLLTHSINSLGWMLDNLAFTYGQFLGEIMAIVGVYEIVKRLMRRMMEVALAHVDTLRAVTET